MRAVVRTVAGLMLAMAALGCSQRLHVAHIATPEYPDPARYGRVQGTILVTVDIGPDGKVISTSAAGGSYILRKAAEENAEQWVFGPLPQEAEYPIRHQIEYVYKLEGKPKFVAFPAVIKTSLPDRIEITAVPLESDYPPIEDYKPIPKGK